MPPHEEAEGDKYICSFIYSLLSSVTVELKGSRSITSIDNRLISICLLQWVPCCSARVAVSSARLFSPRIKVGNNSQGTCKQLVHP